MAFSDRDGGGIGGWLTFFLLVLGLFTPLRVLLTLYGNLYADPSIEEAYGPAWGALQVLEWGLAILIVGGCWYLVWRMINVRLWRTVRMVVAGLWIIAVGAPLVEVVGVMLIAGVPFAPMMQEMLPEFVRPVVFCAIWTAYLLLSRRVANTYSRGGDADEVGEVFS